MNIHKLVLIGASTGGPQLIEEILSSLPANYKAPICIVQHFPKELVDNFVKSLNQHSRLQIHKAKSGMRLEPGHVYIAGDGKHLHLDKIGDSVIIKMDEDISGSLFVPSVDEMFMSAKNLEDVEILGILLTGIGTDGAAGMVELKNVGAMTIAQDKKSSVVYGMPKEAKERGGAVKVLSFDEIKEEIASFGV